MNKRIITEAIEKTKSLQSLHNIVPLLIEPIEVAIKLDTRYPFGDPASIPPIVCSAILNCHTVAKNSTMDASMLPIVWFQEDYAFPIDELIAKRISEIEWEKHACDYQY
jgi:hypothetical protein